MGRGGGGGGREEAVCCLLCVLWLRFVELFQDKSKRTQGSEPRGSVYLMVGQYSIKNLQISSKDTQQKMHQVVHGIENSIMSVRCWIPRYKRHYLQVDKLTAVLSQQAFPVSTFIYQLTVLCIDKIFKKLSLSKYFSNMKHN